MDVMSLEHNFGKEIETSVQQLFYYFCNNIHLGQWQAAKACLKQLDLNKKNFKFDFNSILIDLIENPESYCHGSHTLQSPYHLSLLLYEYCIENEYIVKRDDQFYDKILFKFIIYSMTDENTFPNDNNNQTQADDTNTENEITDVTFTIKSFIKELIEFVRPELIDSANDKFSSLSVCSTTSSINNEIKTPLITTNDLVELTPNTFECLINLLIKCPLKVTKLFEIIFKYNRSSEHTFLKVHLAAVNKLIETLTPTSSFVTLHELVNLLSIYEINVNNQQLQNKNCRIKFENVKYESMALLQRCFKDICYKFNNLWSNDLDKLDENYRNLYSCLLNSNDQTKNENENSKIDLLNLFCKIDYEVERQITLTTTFNDESYPVLCLVKKYAGLQKKDSYLWRKLFLYCYMENKLILKCLIDECLLLISRNQFDHLVLILSVKEFLNLKPLILLIGISIVQDIHSAKKLISSLCLNSEKGSLIDKIGNLLKTHLDFMTWFQQIKPQLPLNIISQYIDLAKLENVEMTKMLRNTLTDKETGEKTKWVRFVDEVNEKISQIQETCLAIYNGFYCINEMLNAILYSCEYLNRKLHSNLNNQNSTQHRNSLVMKNQSTNVNTEAVDDDLSNCSIHNADIEQIQTSKSNNLENLQQDYTKNVIERMESVRKILNQLMPLNYRLEVLENIYSLIYLSYNDLKDLDEEEDSDDFNQSNQIMDQSIGANRSNNNNNNPQINQLKSLDGSNLDANETNQNEIYDLLVTNDLNLNNNSSNTNSKLGAANLEDTEFSIYGTSNNARAVDLADAANHSSKSTLGSYCSHGSNTSRRYRNYLSAGGYDDQNEEMRMGSIVNIYRRNAGGGGPFLVNDFLCRDILLLIKDLLQAFQSIKSSSTSSLSSLTKSTSQKDEVSSSSGTFNSLSLSISTPKELVFRSAKLQQLVNETLWRFQLIKCDLVQIEYGRITDTLFDADSTALVNDRQELIVYDLIKKRKRNMSTTSSVSGLTDTNRPEGQIYLGQSKRFHQNNNNNNYSSNSESRTLTNKTRALTVNTLGTSGLSISNSNLTRERRKSIESQRSLSLIYPVSKHKRSNLTIMKLLSDIETLSALCLKESRFSEANQLAKMYSSKKDACKSFEFKQIIFSSIYQQTLEDLEKLNKKQRQQQQQQQHATKMVEQSLDLAKITESLVSFEKDSELVRCIFICDSMIISKLNFNLTSSLADYARIKLNSSIKDQIIIIEDTTNNKSGSSDKRKTSDASTTSSKMKRNSSEISLERIDDENRNPDVDENNLKNFDNKNELNKFINELKLKLDAFIEGSQTISFHFATSAEPTSPSTASSSSSSLSSPDNQDSNSSQEQTKTRSTLIDYLCDFDAIYLGLNGNSNKNLVFENIQTSIEKYESYDQMKKDLNILKRNFESNTGINANQAHKQDEETNSASKHHHDVYFSIISLLNNCIRLNDNEDLISTFFYKLNPNSFCSSSSSTGSNTKTNAQDSNDLVFSTIEKFIYKSSTQKSNENLSTTTTTSNNNNNSKMSNYLLSFYEYCKTLYDYFKENSSPLVSSSSSASYFSILNSSPASLICKLLFEDSIKPQLIESLTQKLNLNLTAIILHNSCPRLKLTRVNKNPILILINSNGPSSPQESVIIGTNEIGKTLKNSQLAATEKASNLVEQQKQNSSASSYQNQLPIDKQQLTNMASDIHVYSLNSFYTILNESGIACCSRKKPDEFLRDLLFKLLKFCKSYLNNVSNREGNNAATISPSSSLPSSPNETSSNNISSSFMKRPIKKHQIDIKTAQEMYESAEFKSILNQSQELQDINLYSLKNDNQKLSFFINLYNLLSIHSHFYLTSIKRSKFIQINSAETTQKDTILNQSSGNEFSSVSDKDEKPYLFHNETEKLLFQQRMCYKVGQMGCVSLYDLKYLILLRSFTKTPNMNINNHATSSSSSSSVSSKNESTKHGAKNSKTNKTNSLARPASANLTSRNSSHDLRRYLKSSNDSEPLFKYAFYKLDLDAEPLWVPFLPNESVCDHRVMFTLVNCNESDPPICVYNSDSLLDDQLKVQMSSFLNDSIYADLCDDILYLPEFLIENYSLFINKNGPQTLSSSIQTNTSQTDLEGLVRFLVDYVDQELKENLIGLLELDTIEGENIDQYGRRELPFPIEIIPKSTKFSLAIDHNYSSSYSNPSLQQTSNMMYSSPSSSSSASWYRRQIQQIIKSFRLAKERKLGRKLPSICDPNDVVLEKEETANLNNKDQNAENRFSIQLDDGEVTKDITIELKMDDLNQTSSRQQLNKDCLDYIQKNSPLISSSLSFLFDLNKRNEFFKILSETSSSTNNLTVGANSSQSSQINSNSIEYDESSSFNNSLNRFIQLYVPLDYMKHLSMQTKLNLITQFLLTNKTEESKIELIIDLANYYAQKQEWNLVLNLLNNCTQDNEELNDMNEFMFGNYNTNLSQMPSDLDINLYYDLNSNTNNRYNNSSTDPASNKLENSNGRFSQKDLYNLYDHACICQAYIEAKTNEKSYTHLYKMKNFLKQIRAIFGLMHLWQIDSCLELVDYCLTKSKLYEPTVDSNNTNFIKHSHHYHNLSETHNNLVNILNKKKIELSAYKELTKCASDTLAKYYERKQIQDAAGYYDRVNSNTISESSDQPQDLINLSKMKKICQKCLTWQFAKYQLESSSKDDEETNELIMDLFLLNDEFTSAKYLIKKLNLSPKLQFKLDFGHLKYRLLNLNVSSSIIVIDLDSILAECITFRSGSPIEQKQNDESVVTDSIVATNLRTPNVTKDYMFEICYKLLNELKDLKELNNQVLISLSEYLLKNYKHFLNEQQTNELKTIQLTAKIFQILVQELNSSFDSYKRHHSNPLLIIEQLLMNSYMDLCSKAIKICRDSINEPLFHSKINQLLVRYARKALEFRVYIQQNSNSETASLISFDSSTKSRSPQTISSLSSKSSSKKRASMPIDATVTSSTSSIISSSPGTNALSSSFKTLYKFGGASSNNAGSTSLNTPPNSNTMSGLGTVSGSPSSTFVMPAIPPSKEEWVKDEEVNECMVCNTRRFTLLNRRHHCRRCGRVVCSNCSQRVTLIDNIPRRTCDDCYRQIELQKFHEKRRQETNESGNDTISLSSKRPSKVAGKFDAKSNTNVTVSSSSGVASGLNTSSTGTNNQTDNTNSSNLDEAVNWQLLGGYENETSHKRDDEVRASFRYQQAPSTSLCLSILDLHDQPLECGKDLLSMCDDLSSYLQTANYQVEDFALIINMIKHLLHNAKVKLLQNSSTNMISSCDTYLSLIDVLEQLLLANCSYIPSLYELRNTESVRRIRNRLLEEERHDLAMNLSTKCGLDTQTVWASWGLIELRRGNYKEARTKFEKCLKPVSEKNSSVSQTQLKILNDVVSYLENAPPIRMIGPQTLLAPLRSVEALIAEPKLYSTGENNMDDIQLKESLYYLETYGNYSLIVSFYQRQGFLERSLQFVIDNKCSSDIFVESLLVPCLRSGEFYQLLELMLGMERSQNKLYSYYGSIGKYLEKNTYLNTLYDFQLLMKDYVRACMSCICFFTRYCTSYADLFNNIHYLTKARNHLEQYLELCSIKQYPQNSQTHITWKHKPEQQSLIKHMSTQEVNNYLNAINLQIEVTKFINNCFPNKKEQILSQKAPTLFGSNDTKINLCCLILLSGQSIQEGFGFVIRITECFNLNEMLVFSQIARELAKQYNFKEINNLLKCINESGYKDSKVLACHDECISTCIRVFAAAASSSTTTTTSSNQLDSANAANLQQQLHNKEIEELIQQIKNDENKINAYILNGRLKSAYLIAIKTERVDIVKHISNVAERMGQHLIKDICNKWLEKKQLK